MLAPATSSISANSLTSFDWFLVVVAVVSMALAFQRGFVRVLFSLLGLVMGTLVASWNYLALADRLHRWIASPAPAQAISFLAILFTVMIVFSIAAGFARRAVKLVGLGFVDRLMGAAVGLVRGLLLCVAAMMALTAFLPQSGWIRDSVLAPYFLAGAHAVSFVVPLRLQEQIALGTRHLLEKTPETLKHNLP